jgi:hypothetical protein
MKKIVIFHLDYEGTNHKGNVIHLKEYWRFTSKNRILRDFMDWMNDENKRLSDITGGPVCLKDIKVIGL